ncbi:MAG: hypothetical protein V4443_04180 [Pseudomonadota bacterium]
MRSIATLVFLSLFSAIPAIAADLPAGHPSAANSAPSGAMTHKGKVISTINASIYTYIEVSEGGKNVWIAAPTVAVNKGDTVAFDDGAIMSNFFSKSLNRTFDTVIFVSKAVVVK